MSQSTLALEFILQASSDSDLPHAESQEKKFINAVMKRTAPSTESELGPITAQILISASQRVLGNPLMHLLSYADGEVLENVILWIELGKNHGAFKWLTEQCQDHRIWRVALEACEFLEDYKTVLQLLRLQSYLPITTRFLRAAIAHPEVLQDLNHIHTYRYDEVEALLQREERLQPAFAAAVEIKHQGLIRFLLARNPYLYITEPMIEQAIRFRPFPAFFDFLFTVGTCFNVTDKVIRTALELNPSYLPRLLKEYRPNNDREALRLALRGTRIRMERPEELLPLLGRHSLLLEALWEECPQVRGPVGWVEGV